MTGILRALHADRRGATAAEFALTVPLLLMILVAFVQVGVLFFANAGLQNAVGEAARAATLWPRRTEAQIEQELMDSRFGLNADLMDEPVFTYGREGGQDFVEITVTYTPNLNFIFFEVPGVTLTQTRRAYLP
jgi:Flp pilus assembly protein TadG